jgi:hypothetical protein
MKEFQKFYKTNAPDWEILLSVWYQKGSDFGDDRRGYFASVYKVRNAGDDLYVHYCMSGIKRFLLPVSRKSAKAANAAVEKALEFAPEMVEKVASMNSLKIIEE